ncbi:MAG: sugar phosphate isomerase/epimerase [Pseudomonadales bacterium]
MRTLSLAAGVLPEFEPTVLAEAAVEAGFPAVGFTVRPETWTDAVTATVQSTLRAGNVDVLDVEVIWIGEDGQVTDGHRRILDVGGELGARNALIVTSCTDFGRNCRAFEQLAEHAHRYGIRACLEFLRICAVTHLTQALAIVETVGHPAGGVLIDTLHLARCAQFDKVSNADPARLPYVQFCDGNADCADDYQKLLEDAVDLRALPGEGALPLRGVLSALAPDVPLSLEIRSRALREAYPEPVARARHVLECTHRYLEGTVAA